MKNIANKLYPNKKIKIIPLRFGDRPIEKIYGKNEKRKYINKNINQIIDVWGK